MTSSIVFSEPKIILIPSFLILLSLDTPSVDRKHCISRTKSLFLLLTVMAQVSDAYVAIGRIKAQ